MRLTDHVVCEACAKFELLFEEGLLLLVERCEVAHIVKLKHSFVFLKGRYII